MAVQPRRRSPSCAVATKPYIAKAASTATMAWPICANDMREFYTKIVGGLRAAGFRGKNRPVSRLEHRLMTHVARASADFGLLEPGDRVLVAVSGGKDSHALLYLSRELRRRTPFAFSLVARHVHHGHPG